MKLKVLFPPLVREEVVSASYWRWLEKEITRNKYREAVTKFLAASSNLKDHGGKSSKQKAKRSRRSIW